MLSVDTNILLYAQDVQCPEHPAAVGFLRQHARDTQLALCELVLVELYVLLRNPAVLEHPLSATEAVEVVQAFRSNRHWLIIESSGRVMSEVWRLAADPGFPRRRIFDARLALTLRRRGVTQLATRNARDFEGFGFDRVFDPIAIPKSPET